MFNGRFFLSRKVLPILLVVMMTFHPRTALAYVDPGTGSFLIQGIIAAVVGGAFAVKMYWKKIVALLTGKHTDPEDDPDD